MKVFKFLLGYFSFNDIDAASEGKAKGNILEIEKLPVVQYIPCTPYVKSSTADDVVPISSRKQYSILRICRKLVWSLCFR